jgi:ABC-type bacteriocin/lantibiotic exporter with double-glycine peptidase domain
VPTPPPLFSQTKDDNCTLAYLRMILAYQGIEVAETELEVQANKEPGGVHIENLAKLAESYGFSAEIAELDLDAISNLLAVGVFPVVYLNRVYFEKRIPIDYRYALANAQYHAVVPTRISPTFVTFNDPLPPGKRRRASRRRFEAARAFMSRLCVICRTRPS